MNGLNAVIFVPNCSHRTITVDMRKEGRGYSVKNWICISIQINTEKCSLSKVRHQSHWFIMKWVPYNAPILYKSVLYSWMCSMNVDYLYVMFNNNYQRHRQIYLHVLYVSRYPLIYTLRFLHALRWSTKCTYPYTKKTCDLRSFPFNQRWHYTGLKRKICNRCP
jgi:hypothetical protein